jgi:glutamine phosphoribosylpyrophosphate amidotransferase
MCGIWGIIDYKNKLGPIEKFYLARGLAILNETRGKDSAGFAWVSMDGKKHIHKCEGLARQLDFELIKEARVIIGHTRLGTIGEKTVAQAHPFHYRQHILTHNGTGTAGHNENKWAQGTSGVDSETMLRYIVGTGGFTPANLAAFGEEWSYANYAFGVIMPDNSFLSARETNPFKYAVVKDDIIVYSSEEEHLKQVMILLGIPYEEPKTYEETHMLMINTEGVVKVEKYRDKPTYSTTSYINNYTNNGYWNKDLNQYEEWDYKTQRFVKKSFNEKKGRTRGKRTSKVNNDNTY